MPECGDFATSQSSITAEQSHQETEDVTTLRTGITIRRQEC